jgi:hypothetical protein
MMKSIVLAYSLAMKTIRLTIILVFLWASAPWAQEMAVPLSVQVPLLLKILTFDRNLKERVGEEVVIAVVYQGKFKTSLNVKDEFVKLIQESSMPSIGGIPVRCIALDLSTEKELDQAIVQDSIDVLYVAPLRAVGIETIAGVSRKRKITTLTGVPEYVESGLAVGLGIKGDKAEIIINLPVAKSEGADFSSQLLKLARILT